MVHDPANVLAAQSHSDAKLRGLLGGMSVFTMIMTVPQVLAIWVGHQAAGVSILSWSAYLVSPFVGYGSESGGVTGISICRAWVGLHWMVP